MKSVSGYNPFSILKADFLPVEIIMRVHRSLIVNLNKIMTAERTRIV